jgi:hypothetical protein
MNEMNNTINDKATVYYVGVPEFWNWYDDPEQPVARLPYVIGHPRLGNCYDVRTSVILNKYFDGTIETRNTIYKPMASEGMGS